MQRALRAPACPLQPHHSVAAASTSRAAATAPAPWSDAQRRLSGSECSTSGRSSGPVLYSSGGWHSRGLTGASSICGCGPGRAANQLWGSQLQPRRPSQLPGAHVGKFRRPGLAIVTPVARHRRREYTGDASGKARGRSRGGDNEKASGIVVTSTNSDGSEWNSRAVGRDNGRQGAMTLNEAEEADSGHPGSSRIFFDADKQYAKDVCSNMVSAERLKGRRGKGISDKRLLRLGKGLRRSEGRLRVTVHVTKSEWQQYVIGYVDSQLRAPECLQWRAAGVLVYDFDEQGEMMLLLARQESINLSSKKNRNRHRAWNILGGKRADADVDAAHTATREMVEETGGLLSPADLEDGVLDTVVWYPIGRYAVFPKQVRGKSDLPERYAVMCTTFRKGVPEGTNGAPSIDLLWVPLLDVLHKDSKVHKHVFLASLLKQGTLAGWLLHRRREHRVSLGLPVGPLDPAEQLVMASWGVKLPTSVAAAPKLEALNSDELTSLGGGNSFNGYKQVYGHAMDDVTSRGDGDGDRGSDSRAMQHVRDSNLLPSSWTIELDASLAYAMGLKKEGGGTGGLVISMDQASERIIQALQIQAGSLMRRNWQLAQKEQAAINVDALDLGSVLGSNPELVNERDMAMQARSSTREPAPEEAQKWTKLQGRAAGQQLVRATLTIEELADRVRQADEEEAEEEAVRKAAEVAATRAAVLASLSAPNQEQHSGLLSAVPDRVLEYLGRHRDQQLMRHPAYLLPKALTLREEPSMATAAAAVAFMPVKVSRNRPGIRKRHRDRAFAATQREASDPSTASVPDSTPTLSEAESTEYFSSLDEGDAELSSHSQSDAEAFPPSSMWPMSQARIRKEGAKQQRRQPWQAEDPIATAAIAAAAAAAAKVAEAERSAADGRFRTTGNRWLISQSSSVDNRADSQGPPPPSAAEASLKPSRRAIIRSKAGQTSPWTQPAGAPSLTAGTGRPSPPPQESRGKQQPSQALPATDSSGLTDGAAIDAQQQGGKPPAIELRLDQVPQSGTSAKVPPNAVGEGSDRSELEQLTEAVAAERILEAVVDTGAEASRIGTITPSEAAKDSTGEVQNGNMAVLAPAAQPWAEQSIDEQRDAALAAIELMYEDPPANEESAAVSVPAPPSSAVLDEIPLVVPYVAPQEAATVIASPDPASVEPYNVATAIAAAANDEDVYMTPDAALSWITGSLRMDEVQLMGQDVTEAITEIVFSILNDQTAVRVGALNLMSDRMRLAIDEPVDRSIPLDHAAIAVEISLIEQICTLALEVTTLGKAEYDRISERLNRIPFLVGLEREEAEDQLRDISEKLIVTYLCIQRAQNELSLPAAREYKKQFDRQTHEHRTVDQIAEVLRLKMQTEGSMSIDQRRKALKKRKAAVKPGSGAKAKAKRELAELLAERN